MSIPRSLPLVAAFALVACTPAPERAGPKQDAQVEAPSTRASKAAAPSNDAPTEPDSSSEFGMPDPSQPWAFGDYIQAYKAVRKIAKQDPTRIPRAGSPSFEAMSDLDGLGDLAAGTRKQQLGGLMLSLASTRATYGQQVERDPSFEREHLILGAALLRLISKLPATMVRDEDHAATLRSDASRRKGVLEFRSGVVNVFSSMLEPAPNSTLPPSFACEQLARVIDDVAPLLLADERANAREKLAACTDTSTKDLERIEQALADDAPTAILVTALLEEHRQYAVTQAANLDLDRSSR